VRQVLEDFWKERHRRHGYQLVTTPHIARDELWRRSGHLDYYKENMYTFPIEETGYVIKPMNCPGHSLIYKSRLRSYRELPVRYAELGTVYRYERSGVLHGMMRVRGFTQDDAHIYCTRDQVEAIPGPICPTLKTLVTRSTRSISAWDPRSRRTTPAPPKADMGEKALTRAPRRPPTPAARARRRSPGPRSTSRCSTLSGAFGRTDVQFDFNSLPPDITYIALTRPPRRHHGAPGDLRTWSGS
jgi:hypothetical protein